MKPWATPAASKRFPEMRSLLLMDSGKEAADRREFRTGEELVPTAREQEPDVRSSQVGGESGDCSVIVDPTRRAPPALDLEQLERLEGAGIVDEGTPPRRALPGAHERAGLGGWAAGVS